MIRDLKPYPAYKDSGVPWLGEVPEHWEVLPSRALFAEVRERDHPEEQMLSVTIAKGVIRQRALLADTSKKDSSREDRSAYKLVRPGDVAYNKMRAWQGAVGVSDHQGIVSPAYVVQRPREGADSRYLHHLLRTPAFAKEAGRWSYGITSDMWSLRPEHFRMIYACRPPLPEQSAIVRFLDHADRRIRRFIRAKQELIKLLEEQKQAIIHRAVTRGLDPNVALRPSGVSWLGNIPRHWTVRQMKSLVATVGGMTPNKDVQRYWIGRTPWVSPKDMKAQEIFDSIDHISDAAVNETNISLIKPPVVLIVVRGMILARVFPVAVTRVPVTVNQDMKALLPRAELSADYLAALLTGIQHELLQLVEIAGHGTCCLRTDSWGGFYLPIPPREEQEAIRSCLAAELSTHNAAVTCLRRQIELFGEHRTRLVADVVTGKLDVCEAAASLPDESHEPDMLDDADALVGGDVEAGDAELNTLSEVVQE